jgi:hypothetical protein
MYRRFGWSVTSGTEINVILCEEWRRTREGSDVVKRDSERDESEKGVDPPMRTTAEVAAVVEGVQRAHRGRIRWGIGRNTAELALRAIERVPGSPRRPSSKSRRRKRHKRLL